MFNLSEVEMTKNIVSNINFESEIFKGVSMICNLLSYAFRISMCVFGNWFYYAKDIISNHPIMIKKLEKNTFDNNNPIHIEIGMGKGDFIIGMAEKYPNINFIGIEKYESVLVRALEKVEDLPNNLKLMRFDAKEIDKFIFVKIEALYLNFSDPWPKTRHEKRRLTSKNFLNLYEKLFDEKINIYQKTDNKELFAYSICSLSQNGYILNEVSLDLSNENISNILTEYEKKFTKMGITINYMHATKKI